MEAVEDQLRLRRVLLHRGDVALRHVERDHLDARSTLAAKLGEKAVQGLPLAALAHPDHLAPLVVVDDGQVLRLAPAVADLIDADAPQPAPLARERLGDQPLDDAVDHLPAEPEVARHRQQRGVARHLDDLPLQRLGIARAWPRPGHRLDPDPALPAIHPPQPRREHRAYPEGILGAPAALPDVVVVLSPCRSARRAKRALPARLQPDTNPIVESTIGSHWTLWFFTKTTSGTMARAVKADAMVRRARPLPVSPTYI